MNNNPYMKNNKWYWHDEGYCEYGPYETKEEAEAKLDGYCKLLNGG